MTARSDKSAQGPDGGEPRLSDEVDGVEWIDPRRPLPSPTTPELGEVPARGADGNSTGEIRMDMRVDGC
jgi:hypothetical protein